MARPGWGGLCIDMRVGLHSMVVNQLYIQRPAFPETKNNPPIGLDRNAPVALAVTFQRVQPITVQSQVINRFGNIEARQNRLYACKHIGRQQTGIAAFIESFQPSVPEVIDHITICKASIGTYHSIEWRYCLFHLIVKFQLETL